MGGSKIRQTIVLFMKSTVGSANEREDGDFFVLQYFFQSFNHGVSLKSTAASEK
jgi:hypothetical protein